MSTRDTGIRCALIGIIAVTLLATSGCGWFRSKKEPYKNAAESRPLEIPPDLDQPKTDPAMRIPDVASTVARAPRSEEHTSELQSLMRISYAVFCLKKQK